MSYFPSASRSFFVTVFALLAVALVYDAHAQQQEEAAPQTQEEAIHEAFAQGDARAVLADAAKRIEVDLPGGSSQYSRSQAVYVLQKFFETYPPRRFSWRRTSRQDRSRFLTGRYWHSRAEEPLAVYLHLTRPSGGKGEGAWKLQEVRVKES